MKLKSSLFCMAAMVTMVALSVSVYANPVASKFAPATSVARDEKATPENIDGSKVNGHTQSEMARLSNEYNSAWSANDAGRRGGAFKSMRDLHEADPKNLAVISWLGYACVQENQPQDAILLLEPAIGKSHSRSVNVIDCRNLTVAYYRTGRYSDVIRMVGGMDGGDVDDSTQLILASAYLETKDYGSSIKAYKVLEGHHALDADGCRNLAAAYNANKDYANAVPYFISADKADSSLAPICVAAAQNMVADGHPNEAIMLLEGLDSSARGTSTYYPILANAYIGRGGDGDCDKAYGIAQQGGLDATDLYNVGTFAMQKGHYSQAIDTLNKSVAVHATGKAYNNLGRSYEMNGDGKNAAGCYVKASDLEPGDKLYAKNAAIALAKLGDPAASTYSQRSGEVIGTSFDMATLQNLVTAGKYKEASDLLGANEGKYQDSPEFFFNKGVVLYRLGDMDGSVAAYRRSETLKDDPTTVKNLSIVLYMKKDYVEAKSMCDKYIAEAGRKPDGLQNLGAVLAASGRTTEAIAVWRELLGTSDNEAVRLDLADALWNSGDTQGARFHYSTVLKGDPNSVRALNGLGLYALAQSNTHEAEKYFRSAISADKNFYPAYNNLAIALERLNHVDEAKKTLQDALAIKPDFEEARKNLDRLNGN